MSVPFSNTHLRVPRGFGAILEGLAREVLRDQPEDIPTYAAQYFSALLKQREDSGMDPAEWAANLEDRFYNNHAFKATEVSPETEPAAEVNTSKEKSDESQTEDESSHSTEASNVSKTQPNISEEADLTGSTGEEEEKHDNSEERIILMEKGLSEEESVNRPPAADATADVHPDGVRGTEEEKDPTTTIFDQGDRAASETDSSSVPNQDKPQPDLSLRGISNVDVCAQELETAEDEEGDKHENTGVDKEIVDSEGEEKTEVEEPVEVLPYSGLADVDVCATELAGTEGTVEGATVEDDTHDIEEESLKLQPEEAVEKSSLSQSEIPEDDQQAADDQVEKTKEKEGAETETSSGGMHGSLTHFEGGSDSNVIPKEDSLVEISFEDVPEAQQIKEDGEKPPEEKDSVEEMQQEEESEEVITEPTDQNISGTQDHNEPEMVGVEKEVNSEGEEMESQHEPSDIMNEKVDTGDSNVIASEDDEKGEGVKITSSSHQPTSEADEQNPENETDHKNEEEEKISEGRFQQNESNDPDFKVDETTDTAGGDKEDTEGHSEVVEDQEINDGSAEGHSSQITQSNISTAAMEDTVVEKEVTSKERTSEAEGPVEEGKIDSEIQEKSDEVCEEDRISLSQSADQQAAEHQGEERSHRSEKDATEPAGKSGDKEDCSRPQEEEDIMDIPLDDPEANRAAAKIQAGFRGHMTRKKMKPEDKAEGEERQEDRGQ